MKLFFHLLKYNFIFQKVRLVLLSLVSFLIILLPSLLFEDMKERGSTILQYSSYGLFMIFTMKMNARSVLSFGIKHLQGLPLSKKEIVFHQSIADITHFLPIMIAFLYGFYLSFPGFHLLFVSAIFFLLIVVLNIVTLNKRIDHGRMQHTKANFKNAFVYVKKYFDTVMTLAISGLIIFGIFVTIGENILLLEYAYFVLIIIALFLVYTQTLKMLKDESLSYFLVKRDIKLMGKKVIVLSLPLFAFVSVMDANKKQLRTPAHTPQNEYVMKIQKSLNGLALTADNQKLLFSIIEKDSEGVKSYLEKHEDFPWDISVLGKFIPHLAAEVENIEVLELILNKKPEALNRPGKYKKTAPIQTALRSCKLKTVEFLIKNGANLNHQDIDGNSPVLTAAKHRCYGGVLLLSEKGAMLHLKDNKGQELKNYLEGSGLEYIIRNHQKRSFASEE